MSNPVVIVLLSIAFVLLFLYARERERRVAAWTIHDVLIAERSQYTEEVHEMERYYRDAIKQREERIDDLVLKLAARTYEERMGLETQHVEFIQPPTDEEIWEDEERQRLATAVQEMTDGE